MKKQLLWKLKKMSLQKKMSLFTWVSIIPLAVLLIYSLFSMSGYYKKYDQIVRNITTANEYNLSFKDKLDDTMYRIVIGNENWSNSEEKLKDENPYEQIKEVKIKFNSLYNITTTVSNKKRIKAVIKTLGTLEDRVDDIIANVEETGHYDENMVMLDMNIRILTELIQEKIQEYIYYEASSLEIMRQNISQDASFTLQITSLVFLIILICSWALSKILGREITTPIAELCRSTARVAKGDFKVRVSVDSGDELDLLAESFNSMVDEISSLVDDIKIEQKNLRATELKLLQAQINPHFLYNTLDTIIWLAEDNQKEQITDMVSSLSDFFRTTLSKGKDFITIEEEESHIKSYLEIQQFRYRDILTYEIDISENIRSYLILKLTLQPIIENALYHGLKNKRGLGRINVTGVMKKDRIEITVKDNGIGMDEGTLARLNRIIRGEEPDDSQHGFGMANVQQRIELNFGMKYGMHIESTYGIGTAVIVTIPIIPQMDEKNINNS